MARGKREEVSTRSRDQEGRNPLLKGGQAIVEAIYQMTEIVRH